MGGKEIVQPPGIGTGGLVGVLVLLCKRMKALQRHNFLGKDIIDELLDPAIFQKVSFCT